MGFITGRIHPPPEAHKVGKVKDFYFTKEEMDSFIRRFTFQPACLGHDKSKVIGSVRRISYGQFGELMADLFICERLPLGKQVMEDVRVGKLKGLSINYKTLVEERTKGRIGDFFPIEISVVEVGAMPQSRILAFGTSEKTYVSESGLKELHMGMTPVQEEQDDLARCEMDKVSSFLKINRTGLREETQLLDTIQRELNNPANDYRMSAVAASVCGTFQHMQSQVSSDFQSRMGSVFEAHRHAKTYAGRMESVFKEFA